VPAEIMVLPFLHVLHFWGRAGPSNTSSRSTPARFSCGGVCDAAAAPDKRRCPAAPRRARRAPQQARCGARREAFRAVARLQRAFPGNAAAVAYQGALAPLVDAAAQSPEAADGAYFALEAMRDAVAARPAPRPRRGAPARAVPLARARPPAPAARKQHVVVPRLPAPVPAACGAAA